MKYDKQNARHNLFSKKTRRKIRSKKLKDMQPHLFDKVAKSLPHVFKGYMA